MGQIFNATVYNTKSRECFVEDADKFHANCYSFSTVVCVTHYLLRQAPYNVMWYGHYTVLNNAIEKFLSSDDTLLGISISEDLGTFQRHNEELAEKPYIDRIKFIDEAHNSWKHMNVEKAAIDYFDFKKTLSVKYDGYLINHTKKLAINLKDYYEKSISFTGRKEEYAIDLIPPLTETGDGTLMALFDGCSAEVSEQLIGTWCGDLLQIVDELPEGYNEILCCFAQVWERAECCMDKFGLDDESFILKNDKKERFEATALSFRLKRGKIYNVQLITQDGKKFLKMVVKE